MSNDNEIIEDNIILSNEVQITSNQSTLIGNETFLNNHNKLTNVNHNVPDTEIESNKITQPEIIRFEAKQTLKITPSGSLSRLFGRSPRDMEGSDNGSVSQFERLNKHRMSTSRLVKLHEDFISIKQLSNKPGINDPRLTTNFTSDMKANRTSNKSGQIGPTGIKLSTNIINNLGFSGTSVLENSDRAFFRKNNNDKSCNHLIMHNKGGNTNIILADESHLQSKSSNNIATFNNNDTELNNTELNNGTGLNDDIGLNNDNIVESRNIELNDDRLAVHLNIKTDIFDSKKSNKSRCCCRCRFPKINLVPNCLSFCGSLCKGDAQSIETFKYNLKILFTWIYMISTIYAIPTIVYWYELDLESLSIPYWISVGSILLTNACITLEMLLSFYRKLYMPTYWDRPLPVDYKYPKHVLSMFAAYLPNEVNTLEGPIRAMIKVKVPPNVKFSVLVVHNGGAQKHLNKLIRIIRKIQNELPEGVSLDHLHATASRSKAANINAAVDYVKTLEIVPDILGIFDADHHPHPDNLEKSIKTMVTTKADVVQGRNCINSGSCFLSIEFDIMYCVYHPGGYMVRGFGIFGGSNGYWRTDVLDKVRMDPTMLTEDVNSAMWALRKQYKVVYNRNIVSFEEAPPTFCDLAKQRMRWTQGWSEVALKHSIPLMFGSGFGCGCCRTPLRYQNQSITNTISYFCKCIRRRIGIFFLMIWRELYCYFAAQALPAGIIALIKCTGDKCIEEGLIAMTVILFLFPVINSLVAFFITGQHRHPKLRPKHYVHYALLSMFYELFKFHMSVMGHARNMVGLTKWRVTKRAGGDEIIPDDEITNVRHEEATYQLEVDINKDWHGDASKLPPDYVGGNVQENTNGLIKGRENNIILHICDDESSSSS